MTERDRTDDDVFLVPYDTDQVRRTASTGVRITIGTAVVITVLALLVTVAMWWISAATDTVGFTIAAVVVTALMAAVAWLGWRPVRVATTNRRRRIETTHALRVSTSGLSFPDLGSGVWVDVPWTGIADVRRLRWRGFDILHVELQSGLRRDLPGLRGVDDDAVWRELVRPSMGMVGPRFDLRALQRSSAEIDAAVRRLSGGRLGLS